MLGKTSDGKLEGIIEGSLIGKVLGNKLGTFDRVKLGIPEDLTLGYYDSLQQKNPS